MKLEELLVRLLQCQSITPEDDGAMDLIREHLSDFDVIRIDKNGVKNMFLYKKFSEGKHLCFAGHVDVVPPGEGWEYDPFSATIKDGFVYARGAQDMKSGVAAFVQACKDAKDFQGTLSLLLTSDEEGEGRYGTIEVLKYLKAHAFLPDYAIVAEPTCERTFGDSIKIGRRGSINGVVELFGQQGHAAYPEKSRNTINLIAPILPLLSGYFFDEGDENFAPSQLVITDIRSGMEVTNVTPGYLKLMFNVRNSTKTTKEDIERYIKKVFEGLEYQLKLSQTAKPFVTERESKIVKLVTEATKESVHIKPKLTTTGGTSDARFLSEYGVKSIELGVINDRIHGLNERCALSEVENLKKIFDKVIKNF
ncbi:succinyl-diaminopimelate desuccinylase [Sulfurospirillum sp. 1612]|uniref:succinyl-diaminopimelate desuccinylase n=1 Tax=Sulfurospirillum sp. 1612 TaxID=3094835 RepID=UPI002F930A2E